MKRKRIKIINKKSYEIVSKYCKKFNIEQDVFIDKLLKNMDKNFENKLQKRLKTELIMINQKNYDFILKYCENFNIEPNVFIEVLLECFDEKYENNFKNDLDDFWNIKK